MKMKVFESDEDVRGGKPVFPNTKVPISYLFEVMRVGGFIDNFIERYPTVTKEQVIALLEVAEESLFTPDAALAQRDIVELRECLANVTEALLRVIADSPKEKARPKQGATPETSLQG
jgi:uncharacterized protein (DUF433 family)